MANLPNSGKQSAKSTKTTGSASTGGFMGFPWYVWGLLGAIVLILAFVIIGTGKKKVSNPNQDQHAQKFESPDSAVTGQSPKVYSNNVAAAPPVNPVNANMAVGQGMPLRVYTDPTTGVEMIDAPTGAVPTSTPEGQMLVAENQRLSSAQSATQQNGNAAAVINSTQVQQLEADLKASNEQNRLLDEKINAQNKETNDLRKLVKLQQESIIAMSRQVSNIEPIIESQRQLVAKEKANSKPIVLSKGKSPKIEVHSIVGNIAWVTDGNEKVSTVSIGDRIPATNLIVRAIDGSTNTVIATTN